MDLSQKSHRVGQQRDSFHIKRSAEKNISDRLANLFFHWDMKNKTLLMHRSFLCNAHPAGDTMATINARLPTFNTLTYTVTSDLMRHGCRLA